MTMDKKEEYKSIMFMADKKEEYKAIVFMTARLLALQKEIYYLQMFDLQKEKVNILNAFLEKVTNLHRNNKGARIANQLKTNYFALSEKQAYCISKTAIKYNIEL